MGYIPSLPNSPLFEIGVYNGYFQSEDSNLFLKELIEEAEGLFEIGFSLHGQRIIVIIEAFICDAPARAMITRIAGASQKASIITIILSPCGENPISKGLQPLQKVKKNKFE